MTKYPEQFNSYHLRLLKFLRMAITNSNVALLRMTNGRLGNSFLGVPVLLLTTIGRKSGKERTQPLYYLEDGERLIMVASNAGTERDPAWVLNLQSQPEVSVNVKGNYLKMTGRIANRDEKIVLWPNLTQLFPKWQMMEDRSERSFKVVILEPR